MEANELRIGNNLYPKVNNLILTDKIIKVEPATLMMILGQIDNRGIEFEPIPLTEEILLKCGFKKTWYGYENKEIEIDRDEKDELKLSVNCNEYTIGNPFKYLHQLQNLYFALTGQELEINL